MMSIDSGFEDFAEKFWKISKNHEKFKILENSVWNWSRSNRTTRKVKLGSMPVSGSWSGSGLTLRLRIRIRYQKHEKSQLKNKYWKKIVIIRSKKSGHVFGYVSRERGATKYCLCPHILFSAFCHVLCPCRCRIWHSCLCPCYMDCSVSKTLFTLINAQRTFCLI